MIFKYRNGNEYKVTKRITYSSFDTMSTLWVNGKNHGQFVEKQYAQAYFEKMLAEKKDHSLFLNKVEKGANND